MTQVPPSPTTHLPPPSLLPRELGAMMPPGDWRGSSASAVCPQEHGGGRWGGVRGPYPRCVGGGVHRRRPGEETGSLPHHRRLLPALLVLQCCCCCCCCCYRCCHPTSSPQQQSVVTLVTLRIGSDNSGVEDCLRREKTADNNTRNLSCCSTTLYILQ